MLQKTELIDEFAANKESEDWQVLSDTVPQPEERADVIGIRHAFFTWSKDATPSHTSVGARRRRFVLSVDDELLFQSGKINLVVGPTGSGKTSLLMALLGKPRT